MIAVKKKPNPKNLDDRPQHINRKSTLLNFCSLTKLISNDNPDLSISFGRDQYEKRA